mmetsp:Transcript_4098/g.9807  ORF Transcript_4098/g.9807 Transcript_4098/m.9807 type:complete len:387 (-) Transcript_4098:2999-4159(-)
MPPATVPCRQCGPSTAAPSAPKQSTTLRPRARDASIPRIGSGTGTVAATPSVSETRPNASCSTSKGATHMPSMASVPCSLPTPAIMSPRKRSVLPDSSSYSRVVVTPAERDEEEPLKTRPVEVSLIASERADSSRPAKNSYLPPRISPVILNVTSPSFCLSTVHSTSPWQSSGKRASAVTVTPALTPSPSAAVPRSLNWPRERSLEETTTVTLSTLNESRAGALRPVTLLIALPIPMSLKTKAVATCVPPETPEVDTAMSSERHFMPGNREGSPSTRTIHSRVAASSVSASASDKSAVSSPNNFLPGLTLTAVSTSASTSSTSITSPSSPSTRSSSSLSSAALSCAALAPLREMAVREGCLIRKCLKTSPRSISAGMKLCPIVSSR